MTALPIGLLALVALLGAGLVPGVAPPVAIALLAAACLRPLPTDRRFAWWFLLSLGLCLWTALTCLPIAPTLAGSWRASLAAEAQDFLGAHGALLGEAAAGLTVPTRLSLHPSGSMRWLLLLCGAVGMVTLTASLCTRQRLLVIKGLVLLGGAVAGVGMVGRLVLPQGEWLLWWYPVSEIGGGEALGPFVNRNHFAGFCAMLMPPALALTWHTADPGWADTAAGDDAAEPVPLAVTRAERVLFGICAAGLAAGVLVSRSRGGTAALLFGTVIMALLWFRRGPLAAALATLSGVGMMVLVTLWPDEAFQGRLHGLRDSVEAIGARWPVWLDCVRVWTRVPLAGCGANAFSMVFPRITAWAAGEQASHAESEVMQLLAEGGATGFLLAVAALLAGSWPLLRTLLRRRRGSGRQAPAAGAAEAPSAESASGHRLPYAMTAALGGSLAAIGLASLVDIPLRIPLSAWTAAAVLGLAAAPARRSRSAALWRQRLWIRLGLVGLLVAAVAVVWHRPGWGALYRDREAWLADNDSAAIAAVLAETPSWWQAWYVLGQRLSRLSAHAPTADLANARRDAAWAALQGAVRANPRDPRLRGELARALWQAGRWGEARPHRDAHIALAPTDRGLRQRWLQDEWRAGFASEASDLAYRLAEAASDPAEAAGTLAWIAERELAEGSVQRAREAFLAALEHRPDERRALLGLVQCERRLGHRDHEAVWLERLVASGHADGAAWWRVAEFARADGDRAALEKALAMAVQKDPRRRRAAVAMLQEFRDTPLGAGDGTEEGSAP